MSVPLHQLKKVSMSMNALVIIRFSGMKSGWNPKPINAARNRNQSTALNLIWKKKKSLHITSQIWINVHVHIIFLIFNNRLFVYYTVQFLATGITLPLVEISVVFSITGSSFFHNFLWFDFLCLWQWAVKWQGVHSCQINVPERWDNPLSDRPIRVHRGVSDQWQWAWKVPNGISLLCGSLNDRTHMCLIRNIYFQYCQKLPGFTFPNLENTILIFSFFPGFS